MRAWYKTVLTFLLALAGVLLVLFAILRVFFVDIVTVGHNGMAPTAMIGDQLLLWRRAQLERGDVTLCEHPYNRATMVMGRIIGKAGDRISARLGQLDVNGTAPSRDVSFSAHSWDATLGRTIELEYGIEQFGNNEHAFFQRKGYPLSMEQRIVTRGFFLLGDNRSSHREDSRTFGEVDPLTCRGQLFFRLVAGKSPDALIPHASFEFVD